MRGRPTSRRSPHRRIRRSSTASWRRWSAAAAQTDRAIEHLRKAARARPGDARALAALGELLDGAGRRRSPRLSTYESARALDPTSVPAEIAGPAARARRRIEAAGASTAAIPERGRGSRAATSRRCVGVRLEALVARAAQRQVVITDARGHWAQAWITAVVRAGDHGHAAELRVRSGERWCAGATSPARCRGCSALIERREARRREEVGGRERSTIADVAPTHLSYPAVSVAVASGVMRLRGRGVRPARTGHWSRSG